LGTASVTLDDIKALVAADLEAVDRRIAEQLASDVALVGQVSNYLIHAGGKRLRPLLVVLAARACGCTGSRHIDAATLIEFIHTATLLHDDVVDGSAKRRGRDTANEVFGNQASVLVGDFLYSRAFQIMVALGTPRVMQVLANATNTIAEGEVLQLMNAHDPATTEERYLQVIYRKTAKLFEAGAQIAGILAGVSSAQEAALVAYGKHVGTAFQLIDDYLDYRAAPEELGKNLGDDLAEGKPTLPLIYALKTGTPKQQALIRAAVEQGGLDQLGAITEAIESTGGLEYTAALAQRESALARGAIASLAESPYKRALSGLAEFAVNRSH
jgi:octaprenyl-diphosphate synthase